MAGRVDLNSFISVDDIALMNSEGYAELRASSHLAGQVERSSAKLLLFLSER